MNCRSNYTKVAGRFHEQEPMRSVMNWNLAIQTRSASACLSQIWIEPFSIAMMPDRFQS